MSLRSTAHHPQMSTFTKYLLSRQLLQEQQLCRMEDSEIWNCTSCC